MNLTSLNGINRFFGEWNDERKLFAGHYLYGLSTLFFLLIIKTIFISQLTPQLNAIADFYIFMLLLVGLVSTAERVKESIDFAAANKFGMSFKNFLLAIGIGSGIAFLFHSGLPKVTAPFAAVQGGLGFLPWAFIVAVIIAPDVEEQFFRMVTTPTLGRIFTTMGVPIPNIVGVLMSASLFAIFHFAVFQGTFDLLIASFVFALIAEIGNHFFKSAGFGLGLHYVNNFLAVGGLH